jgi:cytochrome c-type biogenesis protein CcmF
MLPELGLFSLILALVMALLMSTLPLLTKSTALSRRLAQCLFAFVAFSYLCLTLCFVNNDFSVAYVAMNSNSALPLAYRLCAVWGAHEGSMLLWVLILSGWIVAASVFSRDLPDDFMRKVFSILGWVSAGFLLFIVATSNPFLRLLSNAPVNGRDLNPLLQDPGFLIHPPMLYTGYVGFAIVFAFATAALWQGELASSWVKWVRPWTLTAWAFLTLGITLGSWWAYRELGWGGWWFWDPVENASFLPWLVATALVHSLMVSEKRQAFYGWTCLLAICSFSLSLLGTFLVRSGVLTSVHAFAQDPTRGIYMLIFLSVVVGISFALYAWRLPQLKTKGQFKLLSREVGLLTNNVFLTVTMSMVLLGTLYPLFIDALNLGKISVGAPYFNLLFVPLMTPVLLLMGVGPYLQWHNTSALKLWRLIRINLFLTVVLTGFIGASMGDVHLQAILGVALGLWVLIGNLHWFFRQYLHAPLSRGQWGMLMAHCGVAVCALGITLSGALSLERGLVMHLNESATLGPYTFVFSNLKPIKGSNYDGVEAVFQVKRAGKNETVLLPQKRRYTTTGSTMTDAAIDAGFTRDLYVALGTPMGDGSTWSLRLYYKPFIRWIWGGGLLILLGGLCAMSDRRYFKREQRESITARSVTA